MITHFIELGTNIGELRKKKGGEGKGHKIFSSPFIYVGKGIICVVIDWYPETKLESAGYYYDSFTRPLLDDVIWEVHFKCSSPT